MTENNPQINRLREFVTKRSDFATVANNMSFTDDTNEYDPLYDNRRHPHFRPSAPVEPLDQEVQPISEVQRIRPERRREGVRYLGQ